jgi:hypothetical protein
VGDSSDGGNVGSVIPRQLEREVASRPVRAIPVERLGRRKVPAARACYGRGRGNTPPLRRA